MIFFAATHEKDEDEDPLGCNTSSSWLQNIKEEDAMYYSKFRGVITCRNTSFCGLLGRIVKSQRKKKEENM